MPANSILYISTIPADSILYIATVPADSILCIGIVPANSSLYIDTLPADIILYICTVATNKPILKTLLFSMLIFYDCIFQYSDRTWPLLLLGALMFIPGAYHTRIAYYAYKGYEGFSFEDIPEFE